MFNVEDIRKDFPIIVNNPDLIYFDSSATSFKPKCVIDAVDNVYTNMTSNIHRGDYNMSFESDKAYDNTRRLVKEFINAQRNEEIVFTSGDTESLNLVLNMYSKKYLKKGDVVLTTLAEHASSILPLYVLSKEIGFEIKYIPLNEDGSFDIKAYEECFKDTNVKLVAMTYVSNVLAYKYPIKEITEIAHKHNAIVSVDGAQAVPHFKIDVKDLDIDFLSFSSHKMLGPSGVGVLYGKFDLLDSLDPLFYGGGANARFDKEGNIILQKTPLKFEPGTPNIEGVIGLGAAIEYINKVGIDNIEAYEKELITYMMDKLSKLDNVIIYNKNADCSIVSFNVDGIFAQDVGSYLNSFNICVRTGNHCAKVLHNVICSNESVRASLYLYNTKEEIDKFVDALKDITLEKCIGAIL